MFETMSKSRRKNDVVRRKDVLEQYKKVVSQLKHLDTLRTDSDFTEDEKSVKSDPSYVFDSSASDKEVIEEEHKCDNCDRLKERIKSLEEQLEKCKANEKSLKQQFSFSGSDSPMGLVKYASNRADGKDNHTLGQEFNALPTYESL